MITELQKEARRQACVELPYVIDPYLGYLASGGIDSRFRRTFTRDLVVATSQSLVDPANFSINGISLIEPLKTSLTVIALNKRPQLDLKTGRWPGEDIHEYDGVLERPTQYDGDDTQALFVIGVETLINAMSNPLSGYSEEDVRQALEDFWPHVETSLLYDIFVGDSFSDGLLRTLHYKDNPGRIRNRTWRDGKYAFVDKAGKFPKGPLTFYSNNCWWAKSLEAGGDLADRVGLPGFAKSLRKKSHKVRDRLEGEFWMEEEDCYAPALAEGKRIEIVTNESAIGIFTGTVSPDRVGKVVGRMTQPDMTSSIGTRTRSIDDPQAAENGTRAYHNGSVWLHMDTLMTLGLKRNYGRTDLTESFIKQSCQFVREFNCSELGIVKRNGVLDVYRERRREMGCKSQLWDIHGILGVTAQTATQAQPLAA